jgi:tRNA-Thr(GGU) m(6)t(6)A37 methyltransferase TsaA
VAAETLFMTAALRAIGQIKTPYRTLGECPANIDPQGPLCELRIDEDFAAGLAGLVAGQNILVLYWFENVDRELLLQQRHKTGQTCGVFALRSPNRPNPIGAAVVRIESIGRDCLQVRGLDCLDGTPLLDIKPAIFGEQPNGNGS